jgi:hypothetical protein
MSLVWLSSETKFMACHSVANAVHNGDPGDFIYQHDRDADKPASIASHKIVVSRNGKKRAVRVTR